MTPSFIMEKASKHQSSLPTIKRVICTPDNTLNNELLHQAREKVRMRTSDNVLEEESKKKSDNLRKFRVIARMIKNQMVWARNLKDAEAHLKTYVLTDEDEGGHQMLTFNRNTFRPDVKSFGKLTSKAKTLLIKPSWLRTQEELHYLQQFTLHLKCFERYSLLVRRELAKVIIYQSLEKGRVVIRQGDVGFNFYFIVSGSVLVEVLQEDPITGTKNNHIVGELGPGSSFGELALLHETKRRATIVCKENSEFLTLDKPDFENVLRVSHEIEWNTRITILQNHPLLADWSETALQTIAESSNLVEYPPNTIIIKDLSQTAITDFVYLIVKGTCKVVQKLKMMEYMDYERKERHLYLPPLEGSSLLQDKCTIHKWLCLRTLGHGEFFGLGEGGPSISILSNQKVECLAIRKMMLLKQDRKKCFLSLKHDLCSLYPSQDVVFGKYIEQCQWKDYKKTVIQDTLEKLGTSSYGSKPLYRTIGKINV